MTINKATKLRIPNRLLRDKTLSLKAKGLLAVMLDLPENFYMTVDIIHYKADRTTVQCNLRGNVATFVLHPTASIRYNVTQDHNEP